MQQNKATPTTGNISWIFMSVYSAN